MRKLSIITLLSVFLLSTISLVAQDDTADCPVLDAEILDTAMDVCGELEAEQSCSVEGEITGLEETDTLLAYDDNPVVMAAMRTQCRLIRTRRMS